MQPNGEIYTSCTQPTHTFCVEEYDGIQWVCVRNKPVYDCGCRNIVLRDIHLQKKCKCAIGISLNYDNYARSYYNVVQKEDSIISDEKYSVNIIEIHSSVTKA